MICPHCEKSLLRKERPNNVCSNCKRRYALDPKTNPLQISDLRIRRVMTKLTDEGRVPCTPGQLWYALSRKSLRSKRTESGCVALFVAVVATIVGLFSDTRFVVIAGCVVLLGAITYLGMLAGGLRRGRPRVARSDFHKDVLQQWIGVYGSPPPGLVDDRRHPQPGPIPAGSHHAVLLCPDPSIAAFLVAAGLPDRYGLALAREVHDVPARGPVIVLHDAGAHGLLLLQRARGALPGRPVIDAGLPLRTMRGLPNAVPYRSGKPGRAAMAELTARGHFTRGELRWLRAGWTFPLIGAPPARLLAVVERIAERVGMATDPQRRHAAAVGFLTWPTTGER
ncbi:hypothetical protein [Streptomyces zagrosensis]|uniref:Uncharacterized protein n=1 Tax=Streptomyces zagrosensis TaxID=1042984 RepID=A0A7W9QGK6_9ACTN|nr:hypothetical protein [Streptomyces zagrosensis]MBB5939726.1 hypothetical protein [Streptomyces zagrosensis]